MALLKHFLNVILSILKSLHEPESRIPDDVLGLLPIIVIPVILTLSPLDPSILIIQFDVSPVLRIIVLSCPAPIIVIPALKLKSPLNEKSPAGIITVSPVCASFIALFISFLDPLCASITLAGNNE